MHCCLNGSIAVRLSYQHCRLCVLRQAYGVGVSSLYVDRVQSHTTFFLSQMCSCFAIYFWQYQFFPDHRVVPVKISYHLQNLSFILSSLSKKSFPSFSHLCLCVWLKSRGNNWCEHQYWQNAELFMWHVEGLLRFWVSYNGQTTWFSAGYGTSGSKNISVRLQVL